MRVLRLVFTAALLLLSSAAFAEEAGDWQALVAALGQQSEYSGEFTQERHLAMLEVPLVSTGAFFVSAEGRVEWRVKEPFAIEYRFDDGKLEQCEPSSVEQLLCSKIDRKDDPMLHGFFAFFSSVFSQQADLQRWFSLSLDEAAKRLRLQPNSTFMRDALAAIDIHYSGSEQPRVERVTVWDASGDEANRQVLHFHYPAVD